jgi:hypothetical protein
MPFDLVSSGFENLRPAVQCGLRLSRHTESLREFRDLFRTGGVVLFDKLLEGSLQGR